MTLKQEKQAFLEHEFQTFSINAALQHSSTYTTEKEKDRKKVRDALRLALRELAARYKLGGVSPRKHVENIEELATSVKQNCASFLKEAHLRFGVAQKALNLYLKYLWCAGLIPTPPHCPFDATVIKRKRLLDFPADNWTEVDDKTTYEKWARKAEEKRTLAKDESISRWELREWNAAQLGGKVGCSRNDCSAATVDPTAHGRA